MLFVLVWRWRCNGHAPQKESCRDGLAYDPVRHANSASGPSAFVRHGAPLRSSRRRLQFTTAKFDLSHPHHPPIHSPVTVRLPGLSPHPPHHSFPLFSPFGRKFSSPGRGAPPVRSRTCPVSFLTSRHPFATRLHILHYAGFFSLPIVRNLVVSAVTTLRPLDTGALGSIIGVSFSGIRCHIRLQRSSGFGEAFRSLTAQRCASGALAGAAG